MSKRNGAEKWNRRDVKRNKRKHGMRVHGASIKTFLNHQEWETEVEREKKDRKKDKKRRKMKQYKRG